MQDELFQLGQLLDGSSWDSLSGLLLDCLLVLLVSLLMLGQGLLVLLECCLVLCRELIELSQVQFIVDSFEVVFLYLFSGYFSSADLAFTGGVHDMFHVLLGSIQVISSETG